MRERCCYCCVYGFFFLFALFCFSFLSFSLFCFVFEGVFICIYILEVTLTLCAIDVVSWGSAKLGANADVATAAASFGIGLVGNVWARMTGHSSITGNDVCTRAIRIAIL